MDVVLNFFDDHVFDSVYASLVPAVVPTAAAVARGAGLTIFPSNGSYLPMDPSPSRWASLLSFLPGAKDAIAGTPFLSASSSASTFATTTLPGVSAWSRDYIPRQLLSLSIITLLGAYALYFIFATASYFYIFDHRMMKHPKFLKNQVRMEIESSCMAVPAITIMTLPWFMAEIHGYTKLYDDVEQYGWLWLIASVPV
jgi:lathosterol oxidase